jgi:hypothetical protein
MKKVGFALVVVGMLASGMASASDCPFHDKSAREKNVKSRIYNSKTTQNVLSTSQGGADGATPSESSKRR